MVSFIWQDEQCDFVITKTMQNQFVPWYPNFQGLEAAIHWPLARCFWNRFEVLVSGCAGHTQVPCKIDLSTFMFVLKTNSVFFYISRCAMHTPWRIFLLKSIKAFLNKMLNGHVETRLHFIWAVIVKGHHTYIQYDQVEIQNSHNSQYFELSKHLQFVKALYCF